MYPPMVHSTLRCCLLFSFILYFVKKRIARFSSRLPDLARPGAYKVYWWTGRPAGRHSMPRVAARCTVRCPLIYSRSRRPPVVYGDA